MILSAILAAALTASAHTFDASGDAFRLDGRPYVIRCGEMHFARVPRELWRHRLKMIRACGFNAVCAYVFWNFHERVPGQIDFTGDRDVAAFCREAADEGLWVLLRPGPYVCSEWEFGGLPWWLLKEDGLAVRTSDHRFLLLVGRFFSALGRELAPLQITRGGNVVMVQVENEYGLWGKDAAYVGNVRDLLVRAGFEVPFFCGNTVGQLGRGVPEGMLEVVNFGQRPRRALDALRDRHPKGPLMCGEYYPAWFDTWGERHETRDPGDTVAGLEFMLRRGVSFSVYMAHGGTTFGWWSGCNSPFRPVVSSYDYDAPVSESGRPGVKFALLRKLFLDHLNPGESVPEPPAPNPVQACELPLVAETASAFDFTGRVVRSASPLAFERADLGYGFAVYRAEIPAGAGGKLEADVRDFGIVRVDGRETARFDRRYPDRMPVLPVADRARRLEILVDAMGRCHFGKGMNDAFKGIVGAVKLGGRDLVGWEMTCFDWEKSFDRLEFKADDSLRAEAGRFFRFKARLERKDTFLDMRKWNRGMAFVNGRGLGRYWSIGPTQTMYVPGCWLHDGDNEFVVWDADGAVPPDKVEFLDHPVLDELSGVHAR